MAISTASIGLGTFRELLDECRSGTLYQAYPACPYETRENRALGDFDRPCIAAGHVDFRTFGVDPPSEPSSSAPKARRRVPVFPSLGRLGSRRREVALGLCAAEAREMAAGLDWRAY